MKDTRTAHTPGPWKFDGVGYVLQDNTPTSSLYVAAIVDIPQGAGGSPTAEANARLIAAAPELLEALKSVGEFFDTWQIERGPAEDALFEEIDRAIAKAEGQI